MGVSDAWLRIAEAIGPENFLVMWRMADSEPVFRVTGGAIERGYLQMRLRPFKAWMRYQRNRFIETLAAERKTPTEIQEAVEQQLRERISRRHIRTLSRRKGSRV